MIRERRLNMKDISIDYHALLEETIDSILLEEAEKRMANCSPDDLIPMEEIMRRFGIREEDLDKIDVELE